MATFEPTVQLPYEQNYLGWAKETKEPMPDQSTGIALKTAAQGLEGAVSIADNYVKKGIEDEVHQKVDQERNSFTSALETIHGNTQQPSTTNNPMDAMDLMPDQQAKAPITVDNQLSRVQNLHSAYTGNKISETSYYQNLNSILKDVRAQNPGYRDYVDSEVQKITGVNPANAYMASMVKDINEQRAKASAESSYYEKQIVNSGFTGSQEMLNGYQTGKKTLGQVQQWLAGNNERIEGMKNQALQFTLADHARADYQSKAESAAGAIAEHAATDGVYNGVLVRAGDPASKTASQIQDFFKDVTLHPEKLKDPAIAEQVRTNGIMLEQMKAEATAQTYAQIAAVKTQNVNPQTGKQESLADALGPVKLKNIVDAKISSLYDTQLAALKDDNLGLVHATQNIVADRVSNKALQMTEGTSDLSQIMLTMGVLGKLSPALSPELQQKVIGAYEGSSGSIGQDLYNQAVHQGRQAITQTGGNVTPANPYTYSKSQEEQDRAAAATNSGPQARAAAANKLLDFTKALTEKDPRVVDNAISYFYDPKNLGTLSKYQDDYYDPSRSWIIQGRTSAFGKLTDKAITKSIWDRSQNGNPTAWEHYRGWAVNEAASNLTNMAASWSNNVENEQKFKDVYGTGGPTRNYHYYWNSEDHKLGLMNQRGEIIPDDIWRLDTKFFAFRNANKYFQSLANIAHEEGSDPNALIFSTLRQAWPLDQEGQKIFKALVTSQFPPEKKEEN